MHLLAAQQQLSHDAAHLCTHDALHVCAPAVLARDQDAGAVHQALRDNNLPVHNSDTTAKDASALAGVSALELSVYENTCAFLFLAGTRPFSLLLFFYFLQSSRECAVAIASCVLLASRGRVEEGETHHLDDTHGFKPLGVHRSVPVV